MTPPHHKQKAIPRIMPRRVWSVAFSIAIPLILCGTANAQQKKGDKEILFFSSGFFISVDETGFKGAILSGTGAIGTSSGSRGLSLGGKLGYFLTRHNEIGGGTFLFLYHDKFCVRTFEDGRITGESCDSDTYFALGLDGFYRYHFGREGDRRLFFAGADLSAGDVTRNYTGNIRLRPHVGYRYFLQKNVALDFSVGYTAEMNKKRSNSFFPRDREGWIDGQLSLSVVF